VTGQLYTPQEFERFQEMAKVFLKNDPSAASQTTGNLHGLNPAGTLGLFGLPGVDPDMYSTILNANGSFERALPVKGTRFFQHRREILTGITAVQGTNPSNFCGDAARGGELKVCVQYYELGSVMAATDVVEGPKVGLYYTPADVDRRILPNANARGPFVPDVVNRATNQNSQTWKQMKKLGTGLSLQSSKVLWQGVATAPATGAGSETFFLRQPEGIDRLIKTGYTDRVSGIACPGADSRVINFGANLTGSSALFGTIADAVVDQLDGLMIDLGETMGYSLENSTFAFVMHPRMWAPFVRMWPCAYNTIGCQTLVANDGERLNISADEQRRMQEQMYQGRYLMVNGARYPVLFSWGIPLNNVGNDLWNGSLYFTPLTLDGNEPLYIEYFSMNNEQQNEWYNFATGGNDQTATTNNGLYRVERRQKGCLEYTFAGMWMPMLEAPFAAIRWDNITFQDRSRLRSPYPGASYHADGGQTSRGTYSY
jgi:hypothetical protein